MAYTPRLTRPVAGNKYYIRKANGGYSPCIAGKYSTTGAPDAQCNVLPNCVGYALGRFNEIGGYGSIKYLGSSNAENFYANAIKAGLQVGQTPKLGAIMCWQAGSTLAGTDGAGHVAIVEQVISSTQVVTSESGYNYKLAFWTQNRSKGTGLWGVGSSYKFLGFIYNPAVKDEPAAETTTQTTATTKKATEAAKSFDKTLSATYKTTANLNIRNGAGTGKAKLVTIPKGTAVRCYGYYTKVGSVKWLYVVFTYKNCTYTAFACGTYLAKA